IPSFARTGGSLGDAPLYQPSSSRGPFIVSRKLTPAEKHRTRFSACPLILPPVFSIPPSSPRGFSRFRSAGSPVPQHRPAADIDRVPNRSRLPPYLTRTGRLDRDSLPATRV